MSEVFSGYRIDVNGKAAAFCPSWAAAVATVMFRHQELGAGDDDDIDIVYWVKDDLGFSEDVRWSGCGWSTIDLRAMA